MISRALAGVRERLWVLAHDEKREMRPLIDVRALSIGLTAATITDLLLQHRVTVQHGRVHVTGRDPKPAEDPVADSVLRFVQDQHRPFVRDMLRDPGLRLYQRTQAALIAAGVLIEERRRFRSPRLILDNATATWIRGEMTRRFFRTEPVDLVTDSLCALTWALNLHRTLVLAYDPAEADTILRAITEDIPVRAGPGSRLAAVPYLANGVREAVGDLATAAF